MNRRTVAEYRRKFNRLANRGKDDGPPGYRVIAWAAHPRVGAITKAETVPPAGVPWHLHYQRVIRKVQQHVELEVTGIFRAAAVMQRYGDTIVA